MTSRLRGSAKEEPKPATSLLSSKSRTYLGSGREPREKSNVEGSRSNKVSRKNSRGKYDSFPERSSETKYDTNGYRSPPPDDALAEEDPDLLYRRSRDHFGSWNIQDIIGEKDTKTDRRSRFDLFKSNESKKLKNESKHKSPTKDRRSESNERKDHSKSRSPDIDRDERLKSNKKNSDCDKTRTKNHGDDHRPRKNLALLREIENFGNKRGHLTKTESTESTERRYAGNGHSPERDPNDKIRQLIDRFKSNDGDRKSREKSDDWQTNGKFNSLDKKNYHRRSQDVEDDKKFGSVSRKWKENHDDKEARREPVDRKAARNGVNDAEIQNYRSLERDRRDHVDSGGFRKRSDTYSVERGSRKPRDSEDSSKRRSYVYSGSLADGFDVKIQRYEQALAGPRKDPELGNRKAEVKRRSSLKIKDEPHEPHERNGRHSRPLTPPENDDRKFDDRRSGFNAKDWYESNKQFAAKYLQDNSKLRSPNEEPRETYFGDRRGDSLEDPQVFHPIHHKQMSSLQRMDHAETNGESKVCRKSNKNSMEFDRSNGKGESVTIKIRNHAEDRSENERRTKRGVFLNNTEEINTRNRRRYDDESPARDRRGTRDKDWTSSTTPARKIWNYRDGGAQITDVDEGQPCLKCGDACSGGFLQHSWRKNCSTCKCPREAHDVCHEEWVSVRSRLGLKGDGASGSVACDPRELGLAWAPPGLPSHKVEEYFSMLPEISVPRLGTPGERYRDRQLATQLPKQDLAKAYCRHLATEHYTSADDFMAARNEIALDIGTVQEVLDAGAKCAGCNESLKHGSLAVSAGKLGELYHPACFQCLECRELLVDLAYCVYNDAVYCERHYAERLKGRCAACDELIFSGEFTKAMNKDWHSGHFCCWQCDESLTGQRYVLRDEHPYCIKCYESVFANGCEECSKIIGIDSKDLSYKDKHWHEACFLCNKCRVSLVDKQFGSKVDKIYCGNCYDAQFASRCDGCGEIFRAGTKKMEYKTRQWHEKCFCCVVCKNAIGTKSFIPREQEIYCSGCYEDKFATRCVKCNKIITSGGVTYKNEPWHRECFTCSNCSTSLAGQRFTSRDEKPYCADCFGELFAKRCTACTKPITGIGGTRFISFEDRHWHNDCFICAGCKTSLVGRGFITDADDIICPECAKQKLM